MKKSMGQIIKELRVERGFTQNFLAELIGVTSQAVSKWETGQGYPDISQVIPLTSVFGVTPDFLFGVSDKSENNDAKNIVVEADSLCQYGDIRSYLKAYNVLVEGLKKYPCNLFILNNCIRYGLALSMPENGWIYAKDQADKIRTETIHQANLIISNSKNTSDILYARQALVFLYCADNKFDYAVREANYFPARTDFTLFSNFARINEYMGNYKEAITNLCSEIDYSLQTFEDNIARLGKAYYSCGRYKEAIDVYETFFSIINSIFKNECPLPYHDFDSGDCYLLLAEAYLAINDREKAMKAVYRSIKYYLDLISTFTDDLCSFHSLVESSLIKESKVLCSFDKKSVKKKLLEKLNTNEIQTLNNEECFKALLSEVNNISED